jgi:subtilase family serine protease
MDTIAIETINFLEERMKPTSFLTAFLGAVLLIFPQTIVSAQGLYHGNYLIQDNVLIPESSVRRPEDAGLRARTNYRVLLTPGAGFGPAGGMTPAQIRSFYGMPSSGGHGTIVIVDAYHYATALNDFNYFSSYFGLPQETSTNVTDPSNNVFQIIYASGSQPTTDLDWNGEEALDIEWAHAMAPNAKIVLVEATDKTFGNLFAAVRVATQVPGVVCISMSWGSSTEFVGETSYDSYFNVNGPMFFACAGDTGATVEYPSCSPYVVCAGGTSVSTSSSGTFLSESAWIGGGGGSSTMVAKPSWQLGIPQVTGFTRGVPDLSSDSDPNTGVAIYCTPTGGWRTIGGTSVACPTLAGEFNLSGFSYPNTTALLSAIYSNKPNPAALRDITTGYSQTPTTPTNPTPTTTFLAGTGWDYATGLGVPNGPNVFNAIALPTNTDTPVGDDTTLIQGDNYSNWSWVDPSGVTHSFPGQTFAGFKYQASIDQGRINGHFYQTSLTNVQATDGSRYFLGATGGSGSVTLIP